MNEVVVSKFNLGEKTEDSKIVRKILWSLSESFRAKVTAVRLNLINHLVGFIPCQIFLYFSN